MSRVTLALTLRRLSFPRVSGDVPDMEELGIHAYEFSPRERG